MSLLPINKIENDWISNFQQSILVDNSSDIPVVNRIIAKEIFYGKTDKDGEKIFVRHPLMYYQMKCAKGYKYFDKSIQQLSLLGYIHCIQDMTFTQKVNQLISILSLIGISLSYDKIISALKLETDASRKEELFLVTVFCSTYFILEWLYNLNRIKEVVMEQPFYDNQGDLLALSSIEAGYFYEIWIMKYNGYMKMAKKLYKLCSYSMAIDYFTEAIRYNSEKNFAAKFLRICSAYWIFDYDNVARFTLEYNREYKRLPCYSEYNLQEMCMFSLIKTGYFDVARDFIKRITNEKVADNYTIELLFRQKKYDEALAISVKYFPQFCSLSSDINYCNLRHQILLYYTTERKRVSDLFEFAETKIAEIQENSSSSWHLSQESVTMIIASLYFAFAYGYFDIINGLKSVIIVYRKNFIYREQDFYMIEQEKKTMSKIAYDCLHKQQ